ncbi:MAG: hypothetical protein E7333_05995 [Clostridiales bacterium]|nr:hypothetical protein [Clostridiales bacterium]
MKKLFALFLALLLAFIALTALAETEVPEMKWMGIPWEITPDETAQELMNLGVISDLTQWQTYDYETYFFKDKEVEIAANYPQVISPDAEKRWVIMPEEYFVAGYPVEGIIFNFASDGVDERLISIWITLLPTKELPKDQMVADLHAKLQLAYAGCEVEKYNSFCYRYFGEEDCLLMQNYDSGMGEHILLFGTKKGYELLKQATENLESKPEATEAPTVLDVSNLTAPAKADDAFLNDWMVQNTFYPTYEMFLQDAIYGDDARQQEIMSLIQKAIKNGHSEDAIIGAWQSIYSTGAGEGSENDLRKMAQ